MNAKEGFKMIKERLRTLNDAGRYRRLGYACVKTFDRTVTACDGTGMERLRKMLSPL